MKKSIDKTTKKVLDHLKEDTKEFREQIADDKKLSQSLKKNEKKTKKK